MEAEIRAYHQLIVESKLEGKIKEGIQELEEFAKAEGYDDDRRANLIAYARFLEEKILDIIDDSYN